MNSGNTKTREAVNRRDILLRGFANWVEIDVGDAAEYLDHLIKPEERVAIAMAIQ
jgi:hypothetical protein